MSGSSVGDSGLAVVYGGADGVGGSSVWGGAEAGVVYWQPSCLLGGGMIVFPHLIGTLFSGQLPCRGRLI